MTAWMIRATFGQVKRHRLLPSLRFCRRRIIEDDRLLCHPGVIGN
jgi:hypothetical protein